MTTVSMFLLILVRISAFMVTAPVFSGRQIPAALKIGISVLFSFLLMSVTDVPVEPLTLGMFVMLLLKEALVGIALGLITSIFLYAVQVAGTVIDFQIGLFMGNMFDPTFGTNTMLTGQFKNICAILVLLATNGHHLLIQGLFVSFDWVPLLEAVPAWMDGRLSTFLLGSVAQMFMIGFMIALPISGTMFVVDIGLGIVAKTVPQMNLIAIFPPVKILIHFLIYIFVLPSFFYLLKVLFEIMFESMYSAIKIMGA